MPDDSQSPGDEIGIRGELTPTGFTAGIRSRLASAWDRRLGRKIDEGGFSREERLELRGQRLRHEIALREKVFDAGISALDGNPDRMRQAGLRMIGNLMREEDCLDATFAKVEEHVGIAQQKADAGASGIGADPTEVNPDYMTAWLRFAKDATSERKQDLFARLLAGEVVSPTDPSISTLRVLSELSTHNARTFERTLRSCIGFRMLVRPSLGGFELPDEDMIELQDCGLLVDSVNERFTQVTHQGGPSMFVGGHYSLQLQLKTEGDTLKLIGPRLTPAGVDLAKVVTYDERPLYKRVVEIHGAQIEWAMTGALEVVQTGHRLKDGTRELIWPPHLIKSA